LGLVSAASPREQVPAEFLAAIADRDHPRRVKPKRGPFAYVADEKAVGASYLPDMLCASDSAVRRAVLDNILPDEHCPKSAMIGQALLAAKDTICAEAASVWVPAVSAVMDPVREDFQLNVAGFLQARACKHDDGTAECWRPLIRPTAEALLSIDQDGWPLLQESASQLSTLLKDVPDLSHLLANYDRVVGHLSLTRPWDLGTRVQELRDAKAGALDIWLELQPWLHDKAKPWRQYHACQALLANLSAVPGEARSAVWTAVAEVTGILQSDQHETDAVQVWYLEQELAAHYLRVLDVGGYALHEDRALTLSWWAARRVTGMLLAGLPEETQPAQVRQWRKDPILNGISLAHHTWAWLSPKAYSPGRCATLYAGSPRSLALLWSVGAYAKAHGLADVPAAVRTALRDSFCAALLAAETHGTVAGKRTWVWDEPLIEATDAFFSALPAPEHTEAATQVLVAVKELAQPEEMRKALLHLPSAQMDEAVFICSKARLYCYEHNDAGDLLLERLRDQEWRTSCAANLPLRGWELLVQGLLFLQSRQGLDWAVELPYVFLRAAEAVSGEPERAQFFLMCLVMSSLSGNTAGAIKFLGQSRQLPALKPVIAAIRSTVEKLRLAAEPSVAIRLRGICTCLDQMR
jgi:hypothetical protein